MAGIVLGNPVAQSNRQKQHNGPQGKRGAAQLNLGEMTHGAAIFVQLGAN